ncbi:DUF4136 domain-containing protein [Lacinutrix sp. C3R15]|uniref:DUF4136 domain-containing protein n=1 Tax=Flavobacteriaceae TaxID=49546 RepID=UPI001C08F57A|nr:MULTISPECIES: DUF4136 domain-containing protein [Flavobacteriaceae]MBU2939345.1 DUF4136 domain-containing protein [Lacinutrix sp. C3R15]MDO6622660.1 DUF4136 domain-containing protein [Oceanihabitans sp. 1_MG-2023]
MKSINIVVLVVLFTSCAPVYVSTDFEKGTDFSKYKTYNYYSEIETGLSELDTKRLLNVLEKQLQLQGMDIAETPDFYINIVSKEYPVEQKSTVGVGVGGTGNNVGGGVSIGIPVGQAKITRQILFEFIDENGIGLFWQAETESSYNPNATPEKREAILQNIVEKVLKKYPLKTKE